MNIKKHIPNFLTCCNLFCGCVGIIACAYHNLFLASYCIYVACLFDFFDGFVARALKVSSPIGKDLDSLSDLVSFGVVPSMILFGLFSSNTMFVELFINNHYSKWSLPLPPSVEWETQIKWFGIIPFFSFLIAVFSAIRLAKFNNDSRQSDRFIGLPTPANAIFISSMPFIFQRLSESENPFLEEYIAPFAGPLLYLLIPVLSYLLVAELPLIALKFKNFGWADNKMRYVLIISALLLVLTLNFTAIPIIIILYIILSIIENKFLRTKA